MTCLAVLGLFSLMLCSGCAGVASLASDLNARQVQSCLYFSGSYPPFIGVHGITATGGASLDQCQSLR